MKINGELVGGLVVCVLF